MTYMGGLPWHRGAWHIPKPPWHTAMTYDMSWWYVMRVFHYFENGIVYVMAVHAWCHACVSWRYVMEGICHGGMSWQFRGVLYVMRYVMACYVMAICHACITGVMHVPQVSWMYQRCHACTRYVIECVMQGCHVDMSWWCVIVFSGMSYRYVMVIYVMAICHWDVRYVIQVCHGDMSWGYLLRHMTYPHDTYSWHTCMIYLKSPWHITMTCLHDTPEWHIQWDIWYIHDIPSWHIPMTYLHDIPEIPMTYHHDIPTWQTCMTYFDRLRVVHFEDFKFMHGVCVIFMT